MICGDSTATGPGYLVMTQKTIKEVFTEKTTMIMHLVDVMEQLCGMIAIHNHCICLVAWN
mgnify:CR=1 FL=1